MSPAPIDQTAVQAAMDLLLPRIETAVRASVEAAQARQRTWQVTPATVVKVDGPYAEVIMDDDPDGDLQQVLRLDEHHGVAGGVGGGRARVLVVRIPPHGGYTLGVLPDGRPEETQTDGNEGFLYLTDSDVGRNPGAFTDMAVTFDLTAGYIYGIHLHSQVTIFTAGQNYAECTQDGTIIGRYDLLRPTTIGIGFYDGWVNFVAVEDTEAAVFGVQNAAGSAGVTQLNAAVGPPLTPRTLMGYCFGPARGVTID